MRKTVTFGKIHGNISHLFDVDSERISFDRDTEEEGRIFGQFEYESEARLGSPTTSEGMFVIDMDLKILGLVTETDRPKPESIFRDISENSSIDITAPEYPAEASHDFYRTYGFNGYTTSFRDDIRDYSYDSSFQYVKPDERAQELAMHSRKQMSDDFVEEITEELIDKGMYIASMDIALSEDMTGGYSFTNPLQFVIPEDEFGRDIIHLICRRAGELLRNEVKSVDEV